MGLVVVGIVTVGSLMGTVLRQVSRKAQAQVNFYNNNNNNNNDNNDNNNYYNNTWIIY